MIDMSRTKSPQKTAYDKFMDSEGIPVIEGWYVADVRETERRPWKRLGGKGAFIQLYGQEDITAMYVVEIAPGDALKTERHMYEEIYYILDGSGSAEIVAPDGKAQRFGWKKGDLFGIPLNAPHRLINEGGGPALALAQTNAPIIMDHFHNPEFTFACDFQFTDRYNGDPQYFKATEDIVHTARGDDEGGGPTWRAAFIPDSDHVPLPAGRWKGGGFRFMSHSLVGNTLEGHFAEWPAGQYNKAHAHGGGAVLYIVSGSGYTLMWPREAGVRPYEEGNEAKIIRAPWGEGAVVSPGTGWFHQHFGTGSSGGKSVRQLALRPSGGQNPLGFRRVVSREGPLVSIRNGGSLVDFDLEDPQIRRDFKADLVEKGLPYQMPPEQAP
jgi:mannose-6-phosphate isomerase-like protein (cupin superfamily)